MSVPTSAALRWQRIVREQQASGLSVAAFCRRRGLTQPSFYAWRRRLRQAAGPAPAADAPDFVELKLAPAPQVDAPPPQAALELLLPGQRRVLVRPGFEPHLLRQLLAALEEDR
jgi:transposase-like protein